MAVAEAAYLLHRRTGDADNDGIFNGEELDFGLEPFRDDAAEDPDGDNLDNATELALGTNPWDPDSDGDGLRDDLDSDPLTPRSGSSPVAGVARSGGA
ncbi:MAG: hypothetical protein GWO24_37120, partial [Akkermansiaceae bacterium]|nr:hypothetical protein [Akkermansiaceae bacterium]